MSVSASLDESSVTLEPGGEANLSVRVLNSGSTVEECRFEVVGPCADWTSVEPASLSLYPGTSDTATLKLRPPRSSAIAPGRTPLGLRVVPTSEPHSAVVPENNVTVLPYTEVTAELVPRTTHGAWRGRHKVAVDSRGNTPVTVQLTEQSGTERARLVFAEAEVTIPPGQAKFVALRVRPAQRVWRGASVTHPFQAVVTPKPPEGSAPHEPVVLDGSYEQQAISPSWLPRALVALVLIAAVLTGLWFAVLRPTVRSAAREAVTPEAVEEAAKEANEDGGKKGRLGESSGGDNAGTSGPSGPSGADGTENDREQQQQEQDRPKAGEPGGPAAAKSARVKVEDAVGGGPEQTSAIEVPDGSTFQLTDIVTQNPQGDAGTLVISSEGGQILSLALENFRDSDYHFVTPIEVAAGDEITVAVSCREVGKPVKAATPSECAESVFLGGTMQVEEPEDG
ncbi:hypothetical protein LHJ74_29040 [Streptomyces sp. N2-109]|uniref:Hydrolytic protein n=1 Tax=Streptomyces gossypii TaxID=2883101 RepID=A0ABT2K1P3_9ACTN|nr:hypothetical protein [Streptomyces gossypii]MCT2593906.1 hypothetical protein [Streptomyces gossypii]